MSDDRTEPGKITIADAGLAGLLPQVYRLRYAVSVEEMNKEVSAADHTLREIRDEFDTESSTILCALVDGQLIATMRLTWADSNLPRECRDQFSIDLFQDFPIESISITSRLVVHKDWRGSAALGYLFNHGYSLSRARGCRINFCHCAPALVRLYEQVGYRRYADAIVDPDVGSHLPLVMLTEDVDHLKRVGSPLLRIARRLDNSGAPPDWFSKHFPEYSLGGARTGLCSDEFIHCLAEQLFETEIGLFRGLHVDDTKRFIQASTVLKCKAGDYIVRRGEVGNEMFLILSGAAEVRRDIEQRQYTITTLGQGQVFGEMAFVSSRPRSASIVAITEMEILVLSQRSLHKLMKTIPETIIQVLLNLSVTLCERLILSNDQLLAYRANDIDTGLTAEKGEEDE